MKRGKSILGLHIDDEFLNIVHLGQTANGLEVHNSSTEHLDAGIIKDGLIIDTEIISQKISNFIKANQLKSCKVIMSLACSTVRLKPSEFPKQTDKQLRKQVEEQVEKYSLFEGREVVFDYCIFEDPVQSTSKQTVLQAVTTRQASDACLAVAQRSRLDLVRIEPVVLPIIKLVFNKSPADSETISLLLALDTSSANISVFRNRLPKFCQNITIGIKDLSENKDCLTYLMEQMKPVLEFAHSLAAPASAGVVLKVVAACDSEKLGAIASQIKESLNDVTVEKIDSAHIASQFNIQGTNGGEMPFFALTSALTAFGICEYDEQLNLVSQESFTRQKTQKEMSLTAKAIAATVLLSIAVLVPLKMKIRSVEAASTETEAKVIETAPMRQKIIDLKNQSRQLKKKLSVYDAVDKEITDISWPKILQVIGDTVPKEVRIVEITTTDSGDLTLLGEAVAERYVYRFVKELQNDKFIEIAKVEEIEYDDNGDVILVDYKITCKIQLPEGDS